MLFLSYGLYLLAATVCVLSLVALAELVIPGYSPKVLRVALSKVLNVSQGPILPCRDFYHTIPDTHSLTPPDTCKIILEHRFPIQTPDGLHSIPSCPYQWPNGQGDDGKFLSGIENSARWRAKHGSVYRIWSGMHPEV